SSYFLSYRFKLFNYYSLKFEHYKYFNKFTQLSYSYKLVYPIFLFHSISKTNQLFNKSNSQPSCHSNFSSNSNKKSSNLYIVKEISKYLWPKNDFNTKARVCLSLSLLIGSKVNKKFLITVFNKLKGFKYSNSIFL
ncbi:hypothetical protein PCK2_000737, partial [Pneumocystis canis]